ncbi:30S ribosomal protein S15 [Halogeometricum sp. CBA1124]|nr:30S ribosomal protein S15 [Halogeometricum sp. CBA1124]
MARMHTRRRGQSGSDKPVADEPPEWSDVDADDIESRVVELAEQGYDPSKIGLKLRDEGVKGIPIPDVKLATGKKVTTILEENNAAPEIPEDLRSLMERAIRLHEHLDDHPNDNQNKRALQNTESKVRRKVNYYRGDKLDEDFNYSYGVAKRALATDGGGSRGGAVAGTGSVSSPQDLPQPEPGGSSTESDVRISDEDIKISDRDLKKYG